MRLLSDWKRVIRKAWSMRLMALAVVLTAVETALPFFSDTIPRGIFAALSGLVIVGGMASRILVQKDLQDGKQN